MVMLLLLLPSLLALSAPASSDPGAPAQIRISVTLPINHDQRYRDTQALSKILLGNSVQNRIVPRPSSGQTPHTQNQSILIFESSAWLLWDESTLEQLREFWGKDNVVFKNIPNQGREPGAETVDPALPRSKLSVSKTLNLARDADGDLDRLFDNASTSGELAASDAISAIIKKEAADAGIDEEVLRTVIQVKSNFNPNKSGGGAHGLMMVSPRTAAWVLNLKEPPSPLQLQNPEVNIRAGARLLAKTLDRYDGNLELALAAYQAGMGRVEKGGTVPQKWGAQNFVDAFKNAWRAVASPIIATQGLITEVAQIKPTSQNENKSLSREDIGLIITQEAELAGVGVELMEAIAKAKSGHDPQRPGGLMGVSAGSANWVLPKGEKSISRQDLQDARVNARSASRIMARYLKICGGDQRCALASYQAGHRYAKENNYKGRGIELFFSRMGLPVDAVNSMVRKLVVSDQAPKMELSETGPQTRVATVNVNNEERQWHPPLLKLGSNVQAEDGIFIDAIIRRSSWRANDATQRTTHVPARLTLHHTGGASSSNAERSSFIARNIQHYHMKQRPGAKLFDIGYHYLLDSAGNLIEGVPTGFEGEHVKGENPGNVGIALMGSYHEGNALSGPQTLSLVNIAAETALKYRIDVSRDDFLVGHRYWSGKTGRGYNICPGNNVHNRIPDLRRMVIEKVCAAGGGVGCINLPIGV
ncbi:MAG: hypothetical protein COB53_10945 [Elusimicrobia bacterium]|nr:MAG: hypothetical protein COB53_10945 [Elusimicrobiota bacterium]